MRMSQRGPTAAELLRTLDERSLSRILSEYGEERYARSIARNIVRTRAQQPLETTLALAELVKASIPAAARREGGHPARRTFQALRIAVNGELDMLSTGLDVMFGLLNPSGRLAAITFTPWRIGWSSSGLPPGARDAFARRFPCLRLRQKTARTAAI